MMKAKERHFLFLILNPGMCFFLVEESVIFLTAKVKKRIPFPSAGCFSFSLVMVLINEREAAFILELEDLSQSTDFL